MPPRVPKECARAACCICVHDLDTKRPSVYLRMHTPPSHAVRRVDRTSALALARGVLGALFREGTTDKA